MPRAHRQKQSDRYSFKTGIGYSAMLLGRSDNYGPRPFPKDVLRAQFIDDRKARGGVLSGGWEARFDAGVEDLIRQNILRRNNGGLYLTTTARNKFRIIRREAREHPWEHRRRFVLEKIKAAVGPVNGITKAQLFRENNDLNAQLAASRPQPLQSWSSMSTVDGGDDRLDVSVHQEEPEPSNIPVAGFASPVRPGPQARPDAEAAYPSPAATPVAGSSKMAAQQYDVNMDIDGDDADHALQPIDWHRDPGNRPAAQATPVCRGHEETILNLKEELAKKESDYTKLEELLTQFENKVKVLERARMGSAVNTEQATKRTPGERLAALQTRFETLFAERDNLRRQLDRVDQELKDTKELLEKEQRVIESWRRLYHFFYRPNADKVKELHAKVQQLERKYEQLADYVDKLEGTAAAAAQAQLEVLKASPRRK